MRDLSDKVLYCAQMMRLVRWICELAGDSYLKRLFGRMLFVYLDSYVELGRKLKNDLRAARHDVREAETILNRMADDRDRYFGVIRDRLTAHRQELLLADIVERWYEIEDYSLLILSDDGGRAYSLLAEVDARLRPFSAPPDTWNEPLCRYLVERLKRGEPSAAIGMDTLALTREHTIYTLDVCDLQRCASRITSVLDVIGALNALRHGLPAAKDSERLLKAMLVIEACSLVECLYPPTVANQHSAPNLLAIMTPYGDMDVSALTSAHAARNAGVEQRVRDVRNTICAHIDRADQLSNALAALDALSYADLQAMVEPAESAFWSCCQSNIHLKGYLLHRMPFPVPVATQLSDGQIP